MSMGDVYYSKCPYVGCPHVLLHIVFPQPTQRSVKTPLDKMAANILTLEIVCLDNAWTLK